MVADLCPNLLGAAPVRPEMHVFRNGIEWAGLAAGPAAWAISTQGNYSLLAWICHWKLSPVPPLALVLATVALGGAALSWRAWRRSAAGHEVFEGHGRPRAF